MTAVLKTFDEPSGSIFSSYTVLTKAMIGVGILGLSSSLAGCGWYIGIGYTLGAPILMILALHLTACLAYDFKKAEEEQGTRRPITFYNVASRIHPLSAWFLEIAVLITVFSSAVAYLVVSGTMVADVIRPTCQPAEPDLRDPGCADWRAKVVIYSKVISVAALAYPCSLKSLVNTAVPNALALCCLMYVVSMAFKMFSMDKITADERAETWKPESSSASILAICTYLFAYCCTSNMFGVANEMKGLTVRRLNMASIAAVGTAFILNTAASFLPFLTKGRKTKAVFLSNAEGEDDGWLVAAKVACIIQVTITYVLVIHPMRSSLISLVFRNGVNPAKEFTTRMGITAFCILSTLGVAIAAGEKLSVVFSYAGILGANSLCFVLPSLLFCLRFKRAEQGIMWNLSAALFVISFLFYPAGFFGLATK